MRPDSLRATVGVPPALVDTLSVEALPDVRYTRHVPLTPWVIEYAWRIATQTLLLRTVSAPDPPF